MGSYTTVLGLYKPVMDDTVNVSIPAFSTNSDVLETAITARRKLSDYYYEFLKSGALTVAANIVPPGHRVGFNTTLNSLVARVGTAPLGSALNISLLRSGTTLATVSIAAGTLSGTTSGLTIPLAAGDILQLNVTQIGSSQAGSDLAVALQGS